MQKAKRVPTRVHDRKIDREVARHAMKKQHIPKPNKRLSANWRLFAEN